jgi:hypothetical protein
LTPQALVVGEIGALVSFWPEVRNDDSLAPDVAADILAVWAHCRRFSPETIDAESMSRINRLVHDDAEWLVRRLLEVRFSGDDWTWQVDEIDAAWDEAVEYHTIDELERAICEQFEILDRMSLAVYAADKLTPKTAQDIQLQISAMREEVRGAEEYLADRPDLFLAAAQYAATMHSSYRDDLFCLDESLWTTSLKHCRLEELNDDLDYPASPVPFTDLQKRELRNAYQRFLDNDNDDSGI